GRLPRLGLQSRRKQSHPSWRVWALTTRPVLQARSPGEIAPFVSWRRISLVPAESPKLATPPLSTCWALDWRPSHRGVQIHPEESEEIQHPEALASHTPTRSIGQRQDLAELVVLPLNRPGSVIP